MKAYNSLFDSNVLRGFGEGDVKDSTSRDVYLRKQDCKARKEFINPKSSELLLPKCIQRIASKSSPASLSTAVV